VATIVVVVAVAGAAVMKHLLPMPKHPQHQLLTLPRLNKFLGLLMPSICYLQRNLKRYIIPDSISLIRSGA
jgi:hypothetical protein